MKLTILQAVSQGFTVDTTCYPPVAYKGERFKPDEWHECHTDNEAELRGAIRLLLDQVDYTAGACGLTESVGACLDAKVIDRVKAILETTK